MELAKVLAEDDQPRNKIQADEENYSQNAKAENEAIARKLTVMMELSEGFVADSRLWRWIGDAVTINE